MASLRTERSHGDTRMSFKTTDARPFSKIGLLEESFDSAPCAILPLKESYPSNSYNQSVPLQSLDASVLLRNCSSQASVTSSNSSINLKSHNSMLSSSGLDNDGFTLECIENGVAGSRKPIIAVDYRTISNEQLVVSQYCSNSSKVLNGNGSSNCAGNSSYQIATEIPGCSSGISSQSRAKVEGGNNALLERAGTPRPRGKLRRGRPCHLHLRAFNDITTNPYNPRTACVPWNAEAEAIRLRLNNFILNTDFITDSDSSDDCSSDEVDNNTNASVRAAQPCGETSECSPQKTESVTRKKTECGVSQWRKPTATASLSRDMVQVGCVSRPPPPSGHYTNSISVSPRGQYVSNVNTVSVNASVSIRNNALISQVRSVGKISNVRGGSSIAITTTPTVSALTKVSSVRIVPTPTPTPTPSVTGNSENGSTKLAPPPQRAPFKQNLQESVSPLAIARPELRQLENVASSENIRSTQPSAATSYTPAIACNAQQLNSTSSSQSSPHSPQILQNQSSVSLQQLPSTSIQPTEKSRPKFNISSQQKQSVSVVNQSPTSTQQSRQQHPTPRIQSIPADATSPSTQTTQTSQAQVGNGTSLPPTVSSRTQTSHLTSESDAAAQRDIEARRGDRERRRERRERRRERRAQRLSGALLLPPPAMIGPGQTDIPGDNVSTNPNPPNARLPDLLNSHVPPPYSTLPNGARTHGGGLMPPLHPPGPLLPGPIPPAAPQPIPIHLQHHPPGAPMPPGYPPPPTPGSPIRPPPDCPWPFFGSRRSRGSPRACLGEADEGKSCCGLLVTQAVSIRWFIIMIAFVGLCCTVVGTVLGAVKTHNSEYVTVTLLMIGVGIVLITVSGVAWHLTSRDAPCRVMLGLTAGGEMPVRGGESRRFMTRMTPTFGRPHHPYAAMMYPEFQYRPPPPSYQASMQEYRLRLLLLDRATAAHHPPYPPHPPLGVASPPPIYRSAHHMRGAANTLGRESIYSHPPSYRSREGSISQNPDVGSIGGANLNPLAAPVHSRDPSCLSFLSHDSLYSSHSHDSRSRSNRAGDGSLTGGSGLGIGGGLSVNKDLVEVPGEVLIAGSSKKDGEVLIASTSNNVSINNTTNTRKSNNNLNTSNNSTNENINNVSGVLGRRDGNTVTIVQTTDSSQVIGSQSVIVTVSGNEADHHHTTNNQYRSSPRGSGPHSTLHLANRTPHSPNSTTGTEISVLAHL